MPEKDAFMFTENLAQAFTSLKANKLRSILTMLGVVMGVFSIITILAIGNAAQKYIDAQFEQLGANIISVQERTKSPDSADWLKLEDIEMIKSMVPNLKNIHGFVQQVGEIRISSKKSQQVYIVGIQPQYRNFEALELSSGRFIKENDLEANNRVVLVQDKFARRYYNTADIDGEVITYIDQKGSIAKLKVVGVIKTKPGIFGDSLDEYMPAIMYVPLTTAQNLNGSKRLDGIELAIDDPKADLTRIGQQLVKALEFKHKNEDKYLIQNTADIQASFGEITMVISLVFLAIAIITLIVGGIGIINILLVSVKERTREIGIRRALGAAKRDIVMQFLAESIILTGISGVLGIVIGIAAGLIISNAINIPPVVDIKISILAFIGSILLGVLFGVYPAKKAADLDPIEALRYE